MRIGFVAWVLSSAIALGSEHDQLVDRVLDLNGASGMCDAFVAGVRRGQLFLIADSASSIFFLNALSVGAMSGCAEGRVLDDCASG